MADVAECLGFMEKKIKDLLEEPMRWVGMYIAAASAACVLAIAADLFNGFRSKRFWFCCKYFSLNAFSLTLLAVAMKLPVDLTTDMFAPCDWLAKLGSLVFMVTALGNFMPSLGSMTDQEILANVTALCIFTVTVAANVCIQIFQLRKYAPPNQSILQGATLAAAILILVLLVAFVSLAIMVLTTKRLIDSEYREMHRAALDEENTKTVPTEAEEEFKNMDNFQRALKRYWVMAETGSPQFAIARSVVCTASSAICLSAALGFVGYLIITFFHGGTEDLFLTGSMYGWSTRWILCIQTIGVVVGSVAPTFRYFFSLKNQSSAMLNQSWKKGFKIEKFWIRRLVEWRDRTSDIEIRNLTCRKSLHHTKRMVLNLFIGVQILFVGASKLVVVVSALLVSPFLYSLYLFACVFKKFIMYKKHSSTTKGSRSHKTKLDFSSYVLLLEGEAQLSEGTLKNICHQADKVIQKGKRHQLEHLIELLKTFGDFSGVRDFDSIQIPSLHSQEPPYCWTLPIVTLATIAIAIPNIPKHKSKQLVRSLSEGLPLVKLIDMSTDTNRELSSIRGAADVAWAGVAMYSKWLDNDLAQDKSHKGKDSKDILQELSKKAEAIVIKFKKDAREFLVMNPLYWPFEVIAANAMYRISQTILLAWKGEKDQTAVVADEMLFEKLSVMIADIIAAGLTNLELVITNRCHQNAIEEREKNVHEALLLLGKTEEILTLLQQKKRPYMDPDKAIYIEEWRALVHQDC